MVQLHEQRWCTANAPPANAQEYWQHAHGEAFFEMDVSVHHQEGFSASIVQKPVGPIGYSRLKLNSSQTLNRSSSDIARCHRHQFEFIVMTGGETQLEQNGRVVILRTGDAALVDNRRPYTLTTSGNSRNLVFHFPIEWLNLWLPTGNDTMIGLIRGQSPWGKVVRSITNAVAMQPENAELAKQHLCAEQLAGAVSVALSSQDGRGWDNSANILFGKARELLRGHAHEPDFGVREMAAHLNISERYLHKIFSANSTTFGAELLNVKLERASQMLRNPGFGKVPVEEICWRAGFKDSSHFSRRFRTKFGTTPGQYRGSFLN